MNTESTAVRYARLTLARPEDRFDRVMVDRITEALASAGIPVQVECVEESAPVTPPPPPYPHVDPIDMDDFIAGAGKFVPTRAILDEDWSDHAPPKSGE